MVSQFSSRVIWTGNRGIGTAHYRAYDRSWDMAAPGKPVMACSNDPRLGGDPSKMNPEDLLLSALSSCHMLWYLHYASEAGITVLSYEDTPIGFGQEGADGAGRFVSAQLHPRIEVVAGADLGTAAEIHGRIHEVCFIARSVNFPVTIKPRFIIRPEPAS